MFDSREQEAEQIARWIRSEVDEGRIAPHDVAILVRMRANNVEDELAPVLRNYGLTLRNLARNVGEIAIQDLLAEPLTEVLLPLLRLGARARDPEAWNTTQERLQREVEELSRKLRQTMREELPDLPGTARDCSTCGDKACYVTTIENWFWPVAEVTPLSS